MVVVIISFLKERRLGLWRSKFFQATSQNSRQRKKAGVRVLALPGITPQFTGLYKM